MLPVAVTRPSSDDNDESAAAGSAPTCCLREIVFFSLGPTWRLMIHRVEEEDEEVYWNFAAEGYSSSEIITRFVMFTTRCSNIAADYNMTLCRPLSALWFGDSYADPMILYPSVYISTECPSRRTATPTLPFVVVDNVRWLRFDGRHNTSSHHFAPLPRSA